ncbi:hypothetical protein JOF56_001999 [Kibdelosporangium banguiense]|uniref:Knr4/Smi1-like domain-containing protein n=1 Tax=Kibdelosporangium banguiense TaxID=1365924 RepID=A0ABS4TB26_9PSEU|nr:SMI1/KNR4 family protein [Kibdelosporangium banguiense]MBP2321614.1 hypothetical protein [Kibdelosporangium banguiense]
MTLALPLTADEVASAEHALRIIFPREYREFLLTTSAGGKKVRRLMHTTQGWGWEGDQETCRSALASPFPCQNNPTAGTICIGSHDAGSYSLLVVTGPHRGTMWFDRRTTTDRVVPINTTDGRPMTFTDWYKTPESTWLS